MAAYGEAGKSCGSACSSVSNSVPIIGLWTHATSFSSVSRSKHTLHAMHVRIGALTSPNALRHQCGSAYSARPTDTKSVQPSRSSASASAGSTTRPATKTGIAHRLLDRLRIRPQTAARKRRRLDAVLGQLRAFVAAARQVERRDACAFQPPREFDNVCFAIPSVDEFGRAQANRQRKIRQRLFDARYGLEQETRAVVERSAVADRCAG